MKPATVVPLSRQFVYHNQNVLTKNFPITGFLVQNLTYIFQNQPLLQHGLTSFFDGVSRFTNSAVSNSAQLISGLQAARNRATRLPLGTGSLGPALMFIDNRIRNEEHRVASVMRVMQKAAQFRETAIATDNRVAAMVNHEWEKFYQANPWLRPSPPPGLLERVVRGVIRFHRAAAEIRSNVWNSIVDWYRRNSDIINRVLIGIAFVIAAAVLTVLTGGALLPFLIKAGIVVGLSAAAGGVFAAATGQCVLLGMASGFMAGGIAVFATAVIGFAAIKGATAAISSSLGGNTAIVLASLGKKTTVVGGKTVIKLSNTGKFIANLFGGYIGGGLESALKGKSFLDGAGTGLVLSAAFGYAFSFIPNFNFGNKSWQQFSWTETVNGLVGSVKDLFKSGAKDALY